MPLTTFGTKHCWRSLTAKLHNGQKNSDCTTGLSVILQPKGEVNIVSVDTKWKGNEHAHLVEIPLQLLSLHSKMCFSINDI